MGRECDRFFERIAILVIESAFSGSKNNGGDQGSQSSSHVDDTRAGKINVSDTAVRVVAESVEETVTAPDRMDNNRVDETSKEHGVAKVGSHLTTFSDGTSNNSGCGSGKSELEEESSVVIKVLETKVRVTNKGGSGFVVTTIGESITNGVETDRTTASIQNILQHDVLDILLADGTRTEHGEASLHHENEGSLFTVAKEKR